MSARAASSAARPTNGSAIGRSYPRRGDLIRSIALAVVGGATAGAALGISGTDTIATVAGSSQGFSGDGGPATAAALNLPFDVAADAAGNVYVSDQNNHRLRRINPSGVISTIAGNGTSRS